MEITPFQGTLRLTNSGGLELFFVGVGSAFSRRQYQTNLLVIKGDDHLLIDCGTKCGQGLHELKTPITDIRNFLITHSHADHIGGLEEAALLGRYVTRQRPRMIINETYEYILWEMSLRGGSGFNEENASTRLCFSDLWEPVRPRPLCDYPRETLHATIGSIDIKMMRTKHIPDSSQDWQSSFWSCGVIIDDRIMFTSDTRYDYELIDAYERRFCFDAIFHDCQFFTGGVHASIDELCGFSAEIKSKMHLAHYGDNWEAQQHKIETGGFAGLALQHVYYDFG